MQEVEVVEQVLSENRDIAGHRVANRDPWVQGHGYVDAQPNVGDFGGASAANGNFTADCRQEFSLAES